MTKPRFDLIHRNAMLDTFDNELEARDAAVEYAADLHTSPDNIEVREVFPEEATSYAD